MATSAATSARQCGCHCGSSNQRLVRYQRRSRDGMMCGSETVSESRSRCRRVISLLLAMVMPSRSPMAPTCVGRSAGPPSSSEVRGATDWQTGHRADSLAVFFMVVTETEVTGPTQTPPTLESEALAFDLDGKPLAGCAARQVGKSPRNSNIQRFPIFVNKRDAPSRYCFGGAGSTCTIVHCRSNRNVRSDPFSGSFSASARNRTPSAGRTVYQASFVSVPSRSVISNEMSGSRRGRSSMRTSMMVPTS